MSRYDYGPLSLVWGTASIVLQLDGRVIAAAPRKPATSEDDMPKAPSV